jgi:succinoglycan biosynthesis protein ExoA
MGSGSGAWVSVIVPCRNERDFVEAFCASVLAQALAPGRELEVIIADGGSDDGTLQLLQRLAQTEPRLQVIANPARIVASGLNRALERARGETIVRMDVHTVYAADYIEQCLAALQRSGAHNAGGPWRAEGDTAWSRAIAAAFQSRWVAGGARSRDLGYEGPVDTVYLGCWPRSTFSRFGPFDESLVRNQDDEHNLRITSGGGQVWQSARIRSTYRPRGSLGALFRQWLQYGYWKPFVMRKHRRPAAWRQIVPGLLVAALALLLAASLLGAPWRWLASLLGLYGGVLAGLSLAAADGDWGLLARLPAVILAHHIGYGIGTLLGWWDVLFHGHGRERFARLTR